MGKPAAVQALIALRPEPFWTLAHESSKGASGPTPVALLYWACRTIYQMSCWCGACGVNTHIDIVVHDGDVIEDLSEPGQVGYRFAICAIPYRVTNRSSKVEALSSRLRTQFLEEGEEVI